MIIWRSGRGQPAVGPLCRFGEGFSPNQPPPSLPLSTHLVTSSLYNRLIALSVNGSMSGTRKVGPL